MFNSTHDHTIQAMCDKAFALIEDNIKTRNDGFAWHTKLLEAVAYTKTNVLIKWNMRCRTRLGLAKLYHMDGKPFLPSIELSYHVLKSASYEQQYKTLTHELAHVICGVFEFPKRSHHSANWAEIDRMMGGDGSRLADGSQLMGCVKRNRVQRVKVLDTQTGKEYKTTIRQAARALSVNPARFQEIGRFILGDEDLTSH